MSIDRKCRLTRCHTCDAPIWVPVNDFHHTPDGKPKNFCYPCAWSRLGDTSAKSTTDAAPTH